MKKTLIFIIMILSLLLAIPDVNAAVIKFNEKNTTLSNAILQLNVDNEEQILNICSEAGVIKSFKFIGYVLLIVKIVVPIILIIMGVLDFGKAVLSIDIGAIIKTAKNFLIKLIAAVCIFLAPTVITFVFNWMVSISGNNAGAYSDCMNCLIHPGKCQIPSDEIITL